MQKGSCKAPPLAAPPEAAAAAISHGVSRAGGTSMLWGLPRKVQVGLRAAPRLWGCMGPRHAADPNISSGVSKTRLSLGSLDCRVYAQPRQKQ